jgi:predicted cupin superfamily sugar epimerase
LSTAIYFMLERGDFSALHQIKSDELWHHHSGSSLLIHIFAPDGNYRVEQLGADLAAGDRFQIMVPVGSWFGAELATGRATFALVGCTVAPGFNFSDFTLADRARLCVAYPRHAPLVRRLTRCDDIPNNMPLTGLLVSLNVGYWGLIKELLLLSIYNRI